MDRPKVLGFPRGALELAAAALSMAAEPSYSLSGYAPRPKGPRPKSKHKRKFKGSKAAKKASRR